jgi:hypothetical protein
MAHHTQGSMLDILKKKMRQAKEEMENARDSAEEAEKRHALEIKRREDVRFFFFVPKKLGSVNESK